MNAHTGAAVEAAGARLPGYTARARPKRAKNWDKHVENLERLCDTTAFRSIRDRILELAELGPADRVLDVGAGTGLLALAAAPSVADVTALDVSPAMCRHLEAKLDRLGTRNVRVLTDSATVLPLRDETIDVALSNYCFHHLTDAEKMDALVEIRRVLRGGGRLVIGDMMFGLGLSERRDRAVLVGVVKRMVARGPSGIGRLLRNATRIATGRGEHPARLDWWRTALCDAGFADVSVRALAHEGGIAMARRP
jgi:ubiquinone/menaquinone biosynthesis C-methylase UbiE